MSMMQTYKNITKRVDDKPVIKGFEFIVMDECKNDYYTDQLSVIPKGTVIIADFAGDFGMYGVAEVGGAIHKIKVILSDLHKINFLGFEARDIDQL